MRQSTLTLTFAVLISSVLTAPQEFISFKDGKIGVNFGGYHAGVGIGGLLGNGAVGGLSAEAGTPFGQSAKAGLGGAVDGSGRSSGGLYAGATAGGNVRAAAGLAGGVDAEKSVGTGYASAQAGPHAASSGLGGEAGIEGASGFKFAGTKSFGGTKQVVEQADFVPLEESVDIKPTHKKIHKEFKFESVNEVQPVNIGAQAEVTGEIDSKSNIQPVVVKEVSSVFAPHWSLSNRNTFQQQFASQGFFSSLFRSPASGISERTGLMPWIKTRLDQVFVQPQPVVYEKRIVKYKPRHHLRKHGYIGGYIGGEAAAPAVYKSYSAPAQKRIDIDTNADAGGAGEIGYRKEITYQRNPTFFADIFNIPISTLKAVGSFLTNTAGSTNISVQKTASVQAEPHESSKHALSSTSDSQLHIQTPTASKFIDDILAIPINTLGAVNQFLENNVSARKKVVDETGEEVRVRRGPHARRRASKEVVIIKEAANPADSE